MKLIDHGWLMDGNQIGIPQQQNYGPQGFFPGQPCHCYFYVELYEGYPPDDFR
jgi:hypothetical protein